MLSTRCITIFCPLVNCKFRSREEMEFKCIWTCENNVEMEKINHIEKNFLLIQCCQKYHEAKNVVYMRRL